MNQKQKERETAGRKRHAETEKDWQRQQDKKPHHLLLYLLDLISGVNNIGQKQNQKGQKTRQKSKENKR